jgi:hypothetical protein
MATQNSVNDIYLPTAGGTMTGNLVNFTSTDVTTTTASSGASYTINKALSDIFDITLTANCTLSFSNIPASNTTTFIVILRQDGTGSRTVTWPGSVTWASGSTPTLNTSASAVDIFTFLTDNGGTTVYGFTTGTEPISAYSLVQNNGTPVTKRATLNFAGTGLVATDDSGNTSTDVTLASGISGWNGFASSGVLVETATNTYAARTITGTSNVIAVTNGSGVSGNPTITIDAAYVGQTSITTLGTIATGTWHGSVVGGTYGGTGVNNGANTITIAGNVSTAGSFTTSGAFPLTLTTTASTSVTLPISGTLVNSSVATLSSLSSVGTITTGTWSANLQDYTETLTSASTGSSYTMNLANGNVFRLTLTATATLAFSNVPASNFVSVTVQLVQDGTGSRTVTWPTGTIWAGGTTPTLTLTANHVDVFVLTTHNNGTTWYGFESGANFAS